MSQIKARLTNRGDGSYTVRALGTHNFLGIVRKVNKRRWICAPLGAGADPNVEVTEHSTRRMAVYRLVKN